MSIELTCPSPECRAMNAFADEQAGRLCRCGQCGTPLYVPRRDELPAHVALPVARRWQFLRLKWALIAGVVGLFLVGAVGGYLLFFGGEEPVEADSRTKAKPAIGTSFDIPLTVQLSPTGGATQDGRFDSPKSAQVFKFKAPVNGSMLVRYDAEVKKVQGRLDAYDAARKEIIPKETTADKPLAELRFPVQKGQEYFLKASWQGDKAGGAYRLVFTTHTGPGRDFGSALEIQLPTDGEARQEWALEKEGEEHYFRLVPGTGVPLVAELRLPESSSLDSVLYLCDSQQKPMTDVTNFNVRQPRILPFTAQAGATYYLKVAAFRSALPSNRTGAYILTVRTGKAPSAPVTGPTKTFAKGFEKALELKMLGDGSATMPGRIDPARHVDLFRFQAPRSGRATAKMTPDPGSAMACVLAAYNENGTELMRDEPSDGESYVSFPVVAGQVYYLRATARQTGPYTLRLRTEP
jgi:hypothetical protein